MKNFNYVVLENVTAKTYKGLIEAYNITAAADKIKQNYAMQLNTEVNEITILEIQEAVTKWAIEGGKHGTIQF